MTNTTSETTDNKIDHVRKIVNSIGTAMLITRRGADAIAARPMALVDAGFVRENRSTSDRRPADDALYFATSIESAKIQDVQADNQVTATFQNARSFAALHGTADVIRDRELIDELWTEAWKLWFPEGKTDPSICVVRFAVREAEYWDISGTKALRFLFEAARALVSGEKPRRDESQNAKVTVG